MAVTVALFIIRLFFITTECTRKGRVLPSSLKESFQDL